MSLSSLEDNYASSIINIFPSLQSIAIPFCFIRSNGLALLHLFIEASCPKNKSRSKYLYRDGIGTSAICHRQKAYPSTDKRQVEPLNERAIRSLLGCF